MSTFMPSIQNAPLDGLFVYKLQILRKSIVDATVCISFISADGVQVLLNILLSHSGFFPGASQILSIFMNEGILAAAHDYRMKLVQWCLSVFPSLTKRKSVVIELYCTIIKAAASDDPIVHFETAYPKLFLQMLSNLDEESCRQLYSLVDKLDRPLFVSLCFDVLSHESMATLHALDLLENFTYMMHSDADGAAKVIDRCLQLLLISKGKAQVGLARVLTNLLQPANITAIASKYANQIYEFLQIAFQTDDNEIRKGMLRICQPSELDEKSITFLRTVLGLSCDRRNYKPDSNSLSSTGFLGLRNLGSTCYMNAVFQQLFYTFPFRYMILSLHLEGEANSCLKKIFAELLIGKKQCVDTQPFCSSWIGWNRKKINAREH
jgi:hypothetical protein